MTTVQTLVEALARQPALPIEIILPDGVPVPAHFHVTEVGLVRKDFIDCGGTVRSSSTCVVQVWIANDVEHRLDTTKLRRIFDLAAPILTSSDLPVEVEYESNAVSQYPLAAIDTTPTHIRLHLQSKHTACLAPQLCGVIDDRSCCGTSSCC